MTEVPLQLLRRVTMLYERLEAETKTTQNRCIHGVCGRTSNKMGIRVTVALYTHFSSWWCNTHFSLWCWTMHFSYQWCITFEQSHIAEKCMVLDYCGTHLNCLREGGKEGGSTCCLIILQTNISRSGIIIRMA